MVITNWRMIHDGIQLTVKNCTHFQILTNLNSHQWLKIMTFCIKNSHGFCFVIFFYQRDYLWKRCHWWRLFRDIIFSMGKLNRNANMCGDVSCTRRRVKVFLFFRSCCCLGLFYSAPSLLIVLRFVCVYAVIMLDQGQRTTLSKFTSNIWGELRVV